ncbi:MAG: hypothetical protein R2857_08650 [Vampirovibrionales bacterium]
MPQSVQAAPSHVPTVGPTHAPAPVLGPNDGLPAYPARLKPVPAAPPIAPSMPGATLPAPINPAGTPVPSVAQTTMAPVQTAVTALNPNDVAMTMAINHPAVQQGTLPLPAPTVQALARGQGAMVTLNVQNNTPVATTVDVPALSQRYTLPPYSGEQAYLFLEQADVSAQRPLTYHVHPGPAGAGAADVSGASRGVRGYW